MEFGFEILIIFLMLVFNAVFAAYEMALASVSLSRLKILAESKKSGAKAAVSMKEKMERSLAVVQLGITMVGAVAAAIGGAGVQDSLVPFLQDRYQLSENTSEAIAVLFLVIPLSAVTILFGELVPKVFAIQNNEWVCLKLSPFMRILTSLTLPATNFLEWAVKNLVRVGNFFRGKDKRAEAVQGVKELQDAAGLARASRLITPREEKIVVQASELSSLPVSSTIIPIEDIVSIPLDATLSDALLRAHKDMHTRFPVCANPQDPQTIQGFVNFKDIVVALKINPADPTVKGILRKILTVNMDDSLSKALEKMIQEKTHIATAMDGEGKILGIVTLEDIVEIMMGKIESEYDRLPEHLHSGSQGWIAGGGVKMSRLADLTKIHLTADPEMTLADWLQKRIGRPPESGDVYSFEGFNIQVRKLRRKRLAEAAIRISDIRH